MIPAEWLYGLAGGLMIGLAAAIYLLVSGRIMGASGQLGEIVDGSAGSSLPEKLSLLAGLIVVPGLVVILTGGADTRQAAGTGVVILAGLLVGLGTRLANGCTSGHGVCGISRLAPRGIAATLIYIAAGAATVLILGRGIAP
jgi:uncharacterized protein